MTKTDLKCRGCLCVKSLLFLFNLMWWVFSGMSLWYEFLNVLACWFKKQKGLKGLKRLKSVSSRETKLNVPWLRQREERKMLRELKVFLDQLERDVLRAQGAEGNLTDKYQVSQAWKDKVHCYITHIYQLSSRLSHFTLLFYRHSRASAYSTKWRKNKQNRCFSRSAETENCPWTKLWSNRRGTASQPG